MRWNTKPFGMIVLSLPCAEGHGIACWAAVITSVNCPMSPRAPDGSMSNGTSQQVPADAARLKGRPSNARLRPGWRVRFACGGTSFCALYRTAHGAGQAKEMRFRFVRLSRSGRCDRAGRGRGPRGRQKKTAGTCGNQRGPIARQEPLYGNFGMPGRSQTGAVLGASGHARQPVAHPRADAASICVR